MRGLQFKVACAGNSVSDKMRLRGRDYWILRSRNHERSRGNAREILPEVRVPDCCTARRIAFGWRLQQHLPRGFHHLGGFLDEIFAEPTQYHGSSDCSHAAFFHVLDAGVPALSMADLGSGVAEH